MRKYFLVLLTAAACTLGATLTVISLAGGMYNHEPSGYEGWYRPYPKVQKPAPEPVDISIYDPWCCCVLPGPTPKIEYLVFQHPISEGLTRLSYPAPNYSAAHEFSTQPISSTAYPTEVTTLNGFVADHLREPSSVTLMFDIAPDGSVQNIRVTGSSHGRFFTADAKRLLKNTRYQPAVQNGAPVWAYDQVIKVRFLPSEEETL